MSKSKIHIKPENKGKFNATKKKTGKSTAELTHSKNPVTKKRAIFAQNAAKWNHEMGGYLALGGYPEYGNGGALATAGVQGAASGAAAGMAVLPPWGAIIGGALGGISSMVGANAQQKAEAEAAEASRVANVTESRMAQYKLDNERNTQIPTFEFGGVLDSYYTPQARAFQNMYGLGGDINAINERNSMGYRFFADGGPYEGMGVGFMNRNNPTVQNDIANDPSLVRMAKPGELSKYIGGTAPVPGIKQTFSLMKGAAGVADKVRRTAANSKAIQGAGVINDIRGLFANGGYVENPAWYESNALSMAGGGKVPFGQYPKGPMLYDAMGGYMPFGGMLPTPGSGLPNGVTMAAYKMAAGGHLPEGNATLKEAKEFEKLYPEEFKFGTETEYEHTGNKKLAMRIAADHIKDSVKMNQGGEPDYYKKLQMAGISDELNKLPLMTMAMGGKLEPSKAQEMLKDGKIRGKKLTERQKAYFQAIAHGWKPGQQAMGGRLGGQPMDFPNSYPDGGFIQSGIQGLPIGPHSVPYTPLVDNMGLQAAQNELMHRKAWEQGNRMGNIPQGTIASNVSMPNQQFRIMPNTPSKFDSREQAIIQQNMKPMNEFRNSRVYGAPYRKSLTELDSETFNNYFNQSQNKAFGGSVPAAVGTGRILDVTNKGGSNTNGTDNSENILTEYKGGGTHEQNKYGGIQVGGKAKVEEGEFRFDDPDSGEAYVFSNRF
jgi:hypothetical protein